MALKSRVMCRSVSCLLAFFMLAVVLFCCIPTVKAQAVATTPKVIRVGYPEQAGLTEIDENGVYSGYTYEYLMELAQYTGWEYEFVRFEDKSLNENLTLMMDMLEKGELDLLGSMRRTDELEKIYGYAAHNYGVSSSMLSVLEDNANIDSENYYNNENLRIAVLEGAKRQNSLLEQFCTLNNISPTLVYCKDDKEQLQTLKDKKADLVIGLDLSPMEGTRPVAKFSPEPYYFAVTKGNSEVINQLNYALLRIEEAKPNFSAATYKKYFSTSQNSELVLTHAEQEYVNGLGVITVLLPPDRSPLQEYNMETGEASGIMVDLLSKLSEKAGFKFKYEGAADIAGFNKIISEGKFDLIAGIDYDYEQAKAFNVIMTQSMLTIPYVRIESSVNPVKNATFGFPRSMEYLKSKIIAPNINSVFYNNSIEAIKAVERGELEAAYMDSYAAQKLLNDNDFKEMNLVPIPRDASHICIGMSKQQNTKLMTILDKTLASLTEYDVSLAVYNNTLFEKSMTIDRFVTLYPLQSILIIAAIFMAVLVPLAIFLRNATRMKNVLAANNQCYLQLCELVGEVICEYNYHTDVLTVAGTNRLCFFNQSAYKNFLREFADKATEHPTVEQIFAELIVAKEAGEVNMLCTLPDTDERWLCLSHQIVMLTSETPEFFICKLTDINESVRELEKLTAKAQTDNLTGLYNLDTFRNLVCDELKKQEKVSGVFMIMDVDNFKTINDTYGHYEGDRVLKGIASALHASFRGSDYVARLGGDEFVAFSPGLIESGVVTQKCSDLMKLCAMISTEFSVTLSLGVVCFEQSTDFDTLYKQADRNLYEIKNSTRNGYAISRLDFEE